MKNTQDIEILNLFINRSFEAIEVSEKVYKAYMTTIAYNILGNSEDVKECVNDTLLKVWNTIPPNKPNSIKAYIGAIVRNVALDKYRNKHSKKRSFDNGFAMILDELNECVSNVDDLEKTFDGILVSETISKYLLTLSKEKRYVFISRYYYGNSIKDISKDLHLTQNKVKTMLFRMRKELKVKLEMEGVNI